MSGFAFRYYVDNTGRVRWRAQAKNGKIIADSGQGYEDESACLQAIERFKVKALAAPIINVDAPRKRRAKA